MNATNVAYVSGCSAARKLIREACQKAGFPLVISIFPESREVPGFPHMASLVVIESDFSRRPDPMELCRIADDAQVPVLVWTEEAEGVEPALADRRHYVHSQWADNDRGLKEILTEVIGHPERFTGRVREMAG